MRKRQRGEKEGAAEAEEPGSAHGAVELPAASEGRGRRGWGEVEEAAGDELGGGRSARSG